MPSFLETLRERIVVFDGAMGTNLQVQNLTLDDFGGLRFEGCNEHLLITRPDAVEKVHTAFLDVGCDVIETNSFNGTPVDFAEYDMADQACAGAGVHVYIRLRLLPCASSTLAAILDYR